MTNLEFKCPNCGYAITERDFESNEVILSHLKEIFNKNKDEYISNLKNNWIKEYEKGKEPEIQKKILEEKYKVEKEKQQEIDKIVEEKRALESKVESFDLTLKNKLLEKEQELVLDNSKKIEELNNKINEHQKQILQYKNELDKYNQKLQLEILKKEQELTEQYTKEKEKLMQENEELKRANLMHKVIQNKTKGETFEHDVEGELRKAFEPDDIIEKITSQDKKADYLQKVRHDDKIIGKIVYEVKNAEWSNTWEKKLTEDMAKQESKYGILVATSFNSKFHGIPFKRSDFNPNIYLCDSESFVFVGQIIRTLIKIEHRLSDKDAKESNEALKKFIEWRDIQLPKLSKIFEDSFTRILNSETSIIKRVDEIRIAREKLYSNWLHNIKDYLERVNF